MSKLKSQKSKVAKKSPALFLIGRPNAGKDTQAQLLAKAYALQVVVTSDLIKHFLAQPKKFVSIGSRTINLEAERKKYFAGKLTDYHLVAFLVIRELRLLALRRQGVIFSGSPRSLVEAEAEMQVAREYYPNSFRFIHIKIAPKTSLARGIKRQREEGLDAPEIIKRRLEVFQREVMPAVRYLKREGVLIEVDGEGSAQEVFRAVKNKLKARSKG